VNGTAARLSFVREKIREALAEANRGDDVKLVAVTKQVEPKRILAAYQAGQRVFGESRVHEGVAKIAALRGAMPDARWHLIGHLQTNKAKAAGRTFSLIESVDSFRLASHLSRESGQIGTRLPILLEVNVAGEASKSGFSPEALTQEIAALRELPHVQLRGVMTVAPLVGDPEEVRPIFRRLRELRDRIREEHDLVDLSQLSMGMSNDFPVAVKEGATMVRIGRAIFGERPPNFM